MTNSEQSKRFFSNLDSYEALLKDLTLDQKIQFLKAELRVAKDFSKTKVILMLLHLNSMQRMDFVTALWALNEDILFDPNSTLPLVSKAGLLLQLERFEEAISAIEVAIRHSSRTGQFRRHALAVKARIVLALDDYASLEETLNAIVRIKIVPGQDVGRESDFFRTADKERLSHDCVTRYQDYLARKI